MQKLWITVPLALVAFSAFAVTARADDDAAEAGGEQTITLKQTPRAVRYTLLRESDGADINSVDVEKDRKGKITYEADVVIDDTNYEIDVDPSGLLLSKAIDKDDDAKSATGDDDDKAKKGGDVDDDDDKPSAKSDKDDDAKSHSDADDDDDKPAAKADKDDSKQSTDDDNDEKGAH
jgi:hypothetical protein